MGFHFGAGWLQGGFFGLDVFYVLSGYLITGLLLGEYRRRGRINLGDFWLRRARRLLPALLIMLVAVTLFVHFAVQAGTYPGFRMSAISALFYFSNWWQIASSSNYFVATGPVSPLTHTWSLAVEEQFYLVWPLVVLAVLHFSRSFRTGLRNLLVLSAVGVVASAAEMAALYTPTANTTRLYFGTDTHAQSILIGAVLACSLTAIQMRRGGEGMAPSAGTGRIRALLVAVGLFGFIGTFTLSYAFDGTEAFDYRGGFLVSGLSAAAILLGTVCVPRGPTARVLSLPPLVWLGTISYGAYLWHYPVAIFLDAGRTGCSGFSLLVLRFAVTLGLASASYYLVERPVIYQRFWRSLRAVGPATALVMATVVVVVLGTEIPTGAAPRVVRFNLAASSAAPREVVVLGDSTALTLGAALTATAPAGIKVVNGGLFGCGLAIGTSFSNDPPSPGLPMFGPCNSASPASQQWPALDAKTLTGIGPDDLVLFVAGNWEVQDLLINGRWTNLTDLAFQRYELAQMRKAVVIGTAHGARFVFTTMPALGAGTDFPQSLLPEDSPKRRMIYDRLVREVSAEFPGRATVIDYGLILSPHGAYSEFIDGVQVRTSDGVHTPAYTSGPSFANNSSPQVAQTFYNWLSPRIWPEIVAAGDRLKVANRPTGSSARIRPT